MTTIMIDGTKGGRVFDGVGGGNSVQLISYPESAAEFLVPGHDRWTLPGTLAPTSRAGRLAGRSPGTAVVGPAAAMRLCVPGGYASEVKGQRAWSWTYSWEVSDDQSA